MDITIMLTVLYIPLIITLFCGTTVDCGDGKNLLDNMNLFISKFDIVEINLIQLGVVRVTKQRSNLMM